MTTCDKDGGGVKKSWKSCDVIYGWPLRVYALVLLIHIGTQDIKKAFSSAFVSDLLFYFFPGFVTFIKFFIYCFPALFYLPHFLPTCGFQSRTSFSMEFCFLKIWPIQVPLRLEIVSTWSFIFQFFICYAIRPTGMQCKRQNFT